MAMSGYGTFGARFSPLWLPESTGPTILKRFEIPVVRLQANTVFGSLSGPPLQFKNQGRHIILRDAQPDVGANPDFSPDIYYGRRYL
jgi:hypothetical protein